MATKAATFASKIKNLQESCTRISNGVFPQPSATDISTSLKFFSQILLNVLKDVPSMPIDVICSPEKNHTRTSMFPTLDYKGLYTTLVQLLEIIPQLQSGVQMVGQTLLHTLSCLVPFLEHEYMDTLPYIVASSMAILPSSLHKDLLDMLCYNLLPFTIVNRRGFDNQNFTNISVSAIMMMVFFYTDCPSYYTQLLECLMKLKKDIIKDIFCVIAHGTNKARCPAVELLFQYWPELSPSSSDRKMLAEKHAAWIPISCQHEDCASSLSKEAVKMCIDHTIAIGSGDRAPPMLICIECADRIYQGKSRSTLIDILLPMDEISYTCANKACKSQITQKIAVSTCFSTECVNYNCNKPLRYCAACDALMHTTYPGSSHVVHRTIPSPWKMDLETQSYFVEAIISLLKEAQVNTEKPGKEGSSGQSISKNLGINISPTDESNGNMALEERQLLSRYGIWLIISLCTPTEDTKDEVLGRLLSMLFQWFHYTACLPDDQAGSALEKLKSDCIHGWLMKVVKSHFHIFSNCLLPHPAEYAKVGGHWDCWPSQTNQIKEGFKRLLCLVPYDIITAEVWTYIFPYWMECFRYEVPEEELAELKILLSKVLDPDLSPLGLSPKQMYQFISIRFCNTTSNVQEQALYWIQILTMLEVPVPLKLLYTMFEDGIRSLSNKNRENEPFSSIGKISTHPISSENQKDSRNGENVSTNNIVKNDDENNLHCYILMLDILVKQMDLQDVSSHRGLETSEATPVLMLLVHILNAPWAGNHTCDKINELNDQSENQCFQCLYCEMCAIWYQLALLLMEYFCPLMEAAIVDTFFETPKSKAVFSQDHNKDKEEVSSENANEKINEDLKDFSIKDEKNDESIDPMEREEWRTSQGKFKFKIIELPIQLQLLYILLKKLEEQGDANVIYHIICILKLMCLHSEILNKAAKNQKGFLIWAQENLLITNLWSLLQAEFSQISQLTVPVLLHCITLLAGRDVFLKLVKEDFNNSEWTKRFTAVERVTTIAHFLENHSVKNSPSLQASLANAFCYLVHCLDDIESTIAQRALLNLESIKTSSLKSLLWCLEAQFDLVIMDRPIILQTIFQLYNHLSDRRFLTWDFFFARFDALFLEAQINLERIGEISFIRDLKNSNINSEIYQTKLTRAQEALSQIHVSRSLSNNFSSRLPYKRAVSTPVADIFIKQEKSVLKQTSAPTFRRKSSRFTGSAAIPERFRHVPNNFFASNQSKDTPQEENHIMFVVHKIRETEFHDRDTMHSLMFLLMQFLSRPDQSHPQEEKAMARNQQIVLRHLNILLGFSLAEENFVVNASNLRSFPIFNAVIASMPKVLDFNFKMGTMLLPIFLPLLIYCPSSQRYAMDSNNLPFYSLWLLRAHVRQSWLMSVFIILYKYSYQQVSKQIQALIQIVMNTLESQFHRCRTLSDHFSPATSRSRDMSAASIDLENTDQEVVLEESSEVYDHDLSDGSLEDEEELEPELEAIPESPKSENTNLLEDNQTKSESKSGRKPSSKELLYFNQDNENSHEENKYNESKLDSKISEQDSFDRIEKAKSIDDKGKYLAELKRSPSPKLCRLQRMSAVEAPLKTKRAKLETNNETTQENVSAIEKICLEDQARISQGISHLMDRVEQDSKLISDQTKEKQSKPISIWTKKSAPDDLVMPIKPAQERLLPIGPAFKTRPPLYMDQNKDLQNQKYLVSLGFVNTEIPIPATERLLPIGPTPPYKPTFPPSTRIFITPSKIHAENLKKFNMSLGYLSDSSAKTVDVNARRTFPLSKKSNTFDEQDTSNQSLRQSLEKESLETKTKRLEKQALTQARSLPLETELDKPLNVLQDVSNKSNEDIIEILPDPRTNEFSKDEDKNFKEIQKDNKLDTISPKTKKSKRKTDIKGLSTDSSEDEIKLSHEKENVSSSSKTQKSNLGQSISIDMPDDVLESIKPEPHIDDQKTSKPQYKQRRKRKTGLSSTENQRSFESKNIPSTSGVQRRMRKADSSTVITAPSKRSSASQSSLAFSEDSMHEKCQTCGNVIEEFTEEDIGMCIIILGTYIHREPGMAAPILPEILKLVAKFALNIPYPWQCESNIYLPGSANTIAQQFLRCTLHQLQSNGIFQQIFSAHFPDSKFFEAMSLSLTDCVEMNQLVPLINLFEDLDGRKHLPPMVELLHILSNASHYLECIPIESVSQQAWGQFFPEFDTFLRKMSLLLPNAGVCNLSPIIRMMLITLKLSAINNHKTILDSYSKFISHAIQQSPLEYEQLLELCHLSGKLFTKDRDRSLLTRTIVYELIQAIKFKTLIPDDNLMMLIQFVLQDFNGSLIPSVVSEHFKPNSDTSISSYNTNACESIKQYINDLIEFISDVHTLSRIKSNFLGTSIHLNEETLGGHFKAGLSQILALEITKSNGRDHRAVTKYLPWLYSLPSVQQGPKEFLDCIAHIRLLSWILLGSLQHSVLLYTHSNFSLSQPIPLEANGHIAEHIQVILAGFAEQSKSSVLHMSGLFHAFILCQLWTMYCENISSQNPPGSEQYQQCTLTLSDFWAKITPGILQLVSHPKVLAEMVSLHFLSLMEALMECNSNILARLLPMWIPVFRSYRGQLSGHLEVRLQTCINWQPPPQMKKDTASGACLSHPMLRWLKKIQFKMGQIEIQSSAATQFYCM